MQSAQIKVDTVWLEINIEQALELPKGHLFRCLECHGRVIPSKEYSDGAAAMFSHATAHTGCSLSRWNFSGVRSGHPEAVA